MQLRHYYWKRSTAKAKVRIYWAYILFCAYIEGHFFIIKYFILFLLRIKREQRLVTPKTKAILNICLASEPVRLQGSGSLILVIIFPVDFGDTCLEESVRFVNVNGYTLMMEKWSVYLQLQEPRSPRSFSVFH